MSLTMATMATMAFCSIFFLYGSLSIGWAIVKGVLKGVADYKSQQVEGLENQLLSHEKLNASLMTALQKCNKALEEAVADREKYKILLDQAKFKHNMHLVFCSQKKADEALMREMMQKFGSGFSKEEIEDLLRLCHPDRHPGQPQRANAMTKRLLEMRKKAG